MTRVSLLLMGMILLSMWIVSPTIADTKLEQPVAPGAQYQEIHSATANGEPLIVYVLRLDRSSKNLSVKALKGGNHVVGVASPRTMGESINGKGGEVIATINCDFFCMENPLNGVPCGMIVKDGELQCTPAGWPTVGFDADGSPRMALVKFQGRVQAGSESFPIAQVNRPIDSADQLALMTSAFGPTTLTTKVTTSDVILTDVSPALPFKPGMTYTGKVSEIHKGIRNGSIPNNSVVLSGSGKAATFLEKNSGVGGSVNFSVSLGEGFDSIQEALGGWPILIHDGKLQTYDYDEYLTKPRHTRTAVGWNDKYTFLVAVDNDDQGASVGMNMDELAKFMQSLGCTEAMNLDGGGSTIMAIRGTVMNHTSDGLDREVSSGWAVVNSAPVGDLYSIRVVPENVSMLSGSSVQFRVCGTDADGNPVQINPNDVKWSLEGIDATALSGDPDAWKKLGAKQPGDLIGVLGEIEPTGTFTASKAFRSGQITATVGKIAATTTVNLWEKPAELYIVPALSSVKPGQRIACSVMATDRAGHPMTVDASQVTWKANGARIRKGVLNAPHSGQFTVTATVAGVTTSVDGKVVE